MGPERLDRARTVELIVAVYRGGPAALRGFGENRGIIIGQVALSGRGSSSGQSRSGGFGPHWNITGLSVGSCKTGNMRNWEEGHEKGNASPPCSRRSGDPCAHATLVSQAGASSCQAGFEEFAEHRFFFGVTTGIWKWSAIPFGACFSPPRSRHGFPMV